MTVKRVRKPRVKHGQETTIPVTDPDDLPAKASEGHVGFKWKARRPCQDVLRGKRITEASIFNIDEGDPTYDDKFFRELGEGGTRDLPAAIQRRLQALANMLYKKNGRAFATVENVKDFTVGEGVKIKAADEKVLTLLERHWKLNRWPTKLDERVRALCLNGELLLPIYWEKGTAIMSVTSIDPACIVGYIRDPNDASEVDSLAVAIGEHTEQNPKRIRVLTELSSEQLMPTGDGLPGAEEKEPLKGDGSEAFFFAINRAEGCVRGLPDLAPSIDWLEGTEDFTFALLERASLAMDIVFDILVEGCNNEDELQSKAEKFMRALKSGMAFAHNERMTVSVKQPTMGAMEAGEIFSVLGRQVSSGTRMPCIFYGDAGDLSRSSATELSVSVSKYFASRQRFIQTMLHTILDFQIAVARKNGALPGVKDFKFEVEMPKVMLKDYRTTARAVFDIMQMLVQAIDKGLLTDDESRRILVEALKEIVSTSDLEEGEAPGVKKPENESDKLDATVKGAYARMAQAMGKGKPEEPLNGQDEEDEN